MNKVATQSTTAVGPTDAFRAGNAVDRDITTCMRTGDIGTNSQYKTVWWKVDLGGVYNIYSINILFKNYDNRGNVGLINRLLLSPLSRIVHSYRDMVIVCKRLKKFHSALTIVKQVRVFILPYLL